MLNKVIIVLNIGIMMLNKEVIIKNKVLKVIQSNNDINYVIFFIRVEKEKNQLKAEIGDLQAQVEHVGKNRVSIAYAAM